MPGMRLSLAARCWPLLAVAVAGPGLFFQTAQLGIEDGTLEFTEPIIGGHDMMFVPEPPLDASAVVNGAASRSQLVIRRDNNAAFAAGEVLARLKGKGAHVSDRAGRTPRANRAVGVRSILDHDEVVLAGNGHDGPHIGRLARYMHRHDGPRARRDGGFDG